MSDESTSADTSAEVEWEASARAATERATFAVREGGDAWLRLWGDLTPEARTATAACISNLAIERAVKSHEAAVAHGVLPVLAARLRAGGDAYAALAALLGNFAARADAEDVPRPSPAAVRAARVLAAERVENAVTHARFTGRDARLVANDAAAELRDLAGTHTGTHDEGGDVDERELLWCAARVDGCTTLGELEALVVRWREVA